MQNHLLIIAYDGTAYAGWQRQSDRDTVQQRVERACATVFGRHLAVEGASRTDTGVHALRMAAHVRLPRAMAPKKLVLALNGNLPEDISVRGSAPVSDDFHARFMARGKRYVYRCLVDRVRPAMGRSYCHWLRRPVDLDRMRAGARHLVGRHDFASFASNPGYDRLSGTVRTVQHLHLLRRPHGFDLAVQGDGFLYNMVRAMAGTLLEVGRGRLQPDDVRNILEARDRRRAGATAPAHGLYLLRVLYPKGLVPRVDLIRPGGPLC